MNQQDFMEDDFKNRPRRGQRMGVIKSGKATQDEIPPEEMERLRAFIAGHSWRFAKTMADHPHEYTLRKNARTDEEFVWAVEYIRAHGYDKPFGRATYIYLDCDGWCYWTMGDTIPCTILINRAVIK